MQRPRTPAHAASRREAAPHVGQPLGVLVKPASADCNLACEYCFYHGRESDPYTGVEKRRAMSGDTLDRMLAELLPLAGPQPNFGWQGGEPTLAGIPFFERAVRRQQELKAPHQAIANALQTNAILIDGAWADFLREHRFLVGVSLDGPADLHDRYRLDQGGHGTFARVMRAIDRLRERRVEFNLLCVVNRLTATRPEAIWDFLVAEGFRWLQFIPAVERDARGRVTAFSVTPRQFGDFLCRVFDRWYADGRPTTSVRLFDELAGVGMGQPPNSCQLHPVCGGLYVVVEYSGDVYPCDFFVEERWRMGNLTEQPLAELLRGDALRRFAQVKPNASGKCDRCRWQGVCHNGCPHYRSLGGGRFLELDYLCEAYDRFYGHAVPKLRDLVTGASRRADDVPAVL